MNSWYFLISYFMAAQQKLFEAKNLPSASQENISANYDTESVSLAPTQDISAQLHSISSIFGCSIGEETELSISCENVSLLHLAPQLPDETIQLQVTGSSLPVFNKPFLSHLHQLKVLNLTRNHHRYVTSKAFAGLDNLIELDLSNNDIIVLCKAFSYTKKLVKLNLSSNKIINLGTIAQVVSELSNLKILFLNHNAYIRKIFQDELLPLENSTLETLKLFNTTISLIEEGSFKHLSHLKTLDLSKNYLGEEGLRNVTTGLKETSIAHLYLRELTRLNGFPYEPLSHLENTSIFTLDLGYNYFAKLPKFPPIPSLSVLRLPFCSIRRIEPNAFDAVSNLTNLVLRNNEITSVCRDISSLTNLQTLSLNYQLIPIRTFFHIEDFIFSNMSSLEMLELSYITNIYKISRNALYGLKNLKLLTLGVSHIKEIDDYAFHNLSSLAVLDLHGNQIAHLSNFSFHGLVNLKILLLYNNNIKLRKEIYPFQHSSLLEILYLNDNDIMELHQGIFSSLVNLRVVTLYRNKIVPWNETMFAANSNLSLLRLGKNHITHVTPAMLTDFFHVQHTLDITENPLNCTACGMKDFQDFMLSSNISFYFGNDDKQEKVYRCATPAKLKGQEFLKVEISISQCIVYEINLVLLFASLCPSIIILISATISLCYFFRWYIRYWFFHMKSVIKERKVSKQENRLYFFDAFVSYNSSDTPWILDHLIPALEQEDPRLRLCIHERDFEVGCLITDNILDAIEVSRKVILVLTDSFMKSEWCMFELHMAQHKLFDDTRDALVLVKLSSLDKELYTKNLRYLERTRPSLTWTENPRGQKLFWDKMRKLLQA